MRRWGRQSQDRRQTIEQDAPQHGHRPATEDLETLGCGKHLYLVQYPPQLRKPGPRIRLLQYDGRGEVDTAPLGAGSRRSAGERVQGCSANVATLLRRKNEIAAVSSEAAKPKPSAKGDCDFDFPAQHASHALCSIITY